MATTPHGESPVMMAKGSVIRATLDYLRAAQGVAVLENTLASLHPETRAWCERAEATEEVPYEAVRALWESAHRTLGATDTKWVEASGAYSIEQGGVQRYAGIVRKRSPREFLTQSISLFQLYYHPGDMLVVYDTPASAVLRLVGFDAGTPLFCARQTGGLSGAIRVAGGEEPRVRHVRCTFEGDSYCEWELKWRSADLSTG